MITASMLPKAVHAAPVRRACHATSCASVTTTSSVPVLGSTDPATVRTGPTSGCPSPTMKARTSAQPVHPVHAPAERVARPWKSRAPAEVARACTVPCASQPSETVSTGPTAGCDPPPTPAARLVHGCHVPSALRTVSHGVSCASVASTTSSPAGVVVHAAAVTGPMSGLPSPAIVPRTSPHADHEPVPAAYLTACHSRPAGSMARVLRSPPAKVATALLVTGRMSG